MLSGPDDLCHMQVKTDITGISPVFSVTHERTRNHQRDVQTDLSKVDNAGLTNEMTVVLPLKAELTLHQEEGKSDGLDWYVLAYSFSSFYNAFKLSHCNIFILIRVGSSKTGRSCLIVSLLHREECLISNPLSHMKITDVNQSVESPEQQHQY